MIEFGRRTALRADGSRRERQTGQNNKAQRVFAHGDASEIPHHSYRNTKARATAPRATLDAA